MGSSRWIDDDQIRRKRTPSFPSNESVVSRNAQKQRRWTIFLCTSVPMVIRLNLFFAQSFLSISSVSTEQSQNCVKNTKSCHVRTERPGMVWQSDPLFAPTSSLMTTKTSGNALTTKPSDKNLYWCRIPDNGWCRTVLHDKRHWRVLTIYRTSDMSWVHFAKRQKIILPERLDSKEHPNWTRIGSHNQLPTR